VTGSSFGSTRWSVVLAARDGSRAELGALCKAYWQPLYTYLRRRGYSAEYAKDLTQGYFTRLLEKSLLDHADRERGRFRTFLLASLKNFAANEWHRGQAQKRGGGGPTISLEDAARAEVLYAAGAAVTEATPERLYERAWALTVLERVTAQLDSEFAAAGKRAVFEGLKSFLTGDPGDLKYSQAAASLGMSEGAARVAVYRMRGRFRDLLRAEIARTLADPEDGRAVDEELKFLMGAL
jgi:DNA-directed RNA polymerase specialized sigma24 family protein